jgi:hypothetical protein
MNRKVSMLFVSIGLILVTTVGCAAQQSSAEKSREPHHRSKQGAAMGKMSMDDMMKNVRSITSPR